MVTITLLCQHCQSQNIIRYGLSPTGKQRYLCRDCGRRSRDNPTSNAYSDEERELILRAYDERSSLRRLQRTFGVSRNTVTSWIKKRNQSCHR
jgi:transposase-like protein